ncbi:amino acid permease [Sphingomonas sp. BIUV-7]|uniref:Amino acid permease n=1 Tax=Sphingomonas natans TaxID=3063330 RepID=A0ABT8YCY5_9SPHN|nr:amino acid permease [Sphingomonas sp. BIUV-7]MDO6415485.1 amino acid permease [Sphingomonas sp. BIUV-7]
MRRGVGTWALAASIVNGVVGGGIFTLPKSMAASAGPYTLLVYLGCALVMGAVVICFAESGSRVPTSGGAYGTVEAAFGRRWAFLCGIYIWLASVLACGGIAAAFCDGIATLTPALAGPGPRIAMLLAMFGGIATVNLLGVGLAARIIASGTVIKLIPLGLFLIVGGFAILSGHRPPATDVVAQPLDLLTLGAAVQLALFAFCGMETPLAASGEVADPARTVPKATMLAMVFVPFLYIAIQLVAQGLLGPALAGSAEPLADAMATVSPTLGIVLLFGAALSRLVWIGSDIFGAPRVLFAFGRDGLLPAVFGRVHPTWQTPHVAILFHTGLAFFLAVTGTFEGLAILSTLATAGIYFLACAAALSLRRRGIAVSGQPLAFRLLTPAAWMGMVAMIVLVVIGKTSDIVGFVAVTVGSLALFAVMRPKRAA